MTDSAAADRLAEAGDIARDSGGHSGPIGDKGRIIGMSTRKVSLTLPEELLARAEKAVAAGQARSVSAYIAAAAGSGETRSTVTEVIARWRTEHGEPSATDRADAEARARALFDRADDRLRGPGAA